MLEATSKDQQRFDACQSKVNNVTSLSQLLVNGSNPCRYPEIVPKIKPTSILHNESTSPSLKNVISSKVLGLMIQVVSNIFTPPLFWIVGTLMRCKLQKLQIQDSLLLDLLLPNTTRTIHLGMLPQKDLFRQNFGKPCMWN
jgi:hypothetical protein